MIGRVAAPAAAKSVASAPVQAIYGAQRGVVYDIVISCLNQAVLQEAVKYGVRREVVAWAKQHPTIVPYINASPKSVNMFRYAQDGLVMQLDCDFRCAEDKWFDFKDAIEWTGSGVTLQNGVPYFNGSAKYRKDHSLQYMYNDCTIEVVFNTPSVKSQYMFYIGLNGAIGASMQGNYYTMSCGTGALAPRIAVGSVANKLTTISSIGSALYENGVKKTNSSTDCWGVIDTTHDDIGNGGSRLPYKGLIHSIRIYNRKLTEAEVLANQAIDLARWN